MLPWRASSSITTGWKKRYKFESYQRFYWILPLNIVWTELDQRSANSIKVSLNQNLVVILYMMYPKLSRMRITTVSWWHYSCTLKWSMCLHTVTIMQHAWIGAICQISASALFVLICDSCQIKTVTWLVFLRFSFILNTIKKVLNITLLMLKEPSLTDSRCLGPRFVDLLDCHCPKFSISLTQNWS